MDIDIHAETANFAHIPYSAHVGPIPLSHSHIFWLLARQVIQLCACSSSVRGRKRNFRELELKEKFNYLQLPRAGFELRNSRALYGD